MKSILLLVGLMFLSPITNAQWPAPAQTVVCDYTINGSITPMTMDTNENWMGGVTYFNGIEHYMMRAESMRLSKGNGPYAYEVTGVAISIYGIRQSRPIVVSSQDMIPGQPVEVRSSNGELVVSCYLPILN